MRLLRRWSLHALAGPYALDALETAEHPSAVLEEVWRVLALRANIDWRTCRRCRCA